MGFLSNQSQGPAVSNLDPSYLTRLYDTQVQNNQYVTDQQKQLASALQGRAMGTAGPSIAELQQASAMEDVNKKAAGLSASQKGINPAMAAKLANESQTQGSLGVANQAAILRAQEQQAAQQNLTSLYSGMQNNNQGMMTSYGNQLLGAGNLDINSAQIGARANEQNTAFKQQIFGGLMGGMAASGGGSGGGGGASSMMGGMGGGGGGAAAAAAGGGYVGEDFEHPKKYADGGYNTGFGPTSDGAEYGNALLDVGGENMAQTTHGFGPFAGGTAYGMGLEQLPQNQSEANAGSATNNSTQQQKDFMHALSSPTGDDKYIQSSSQSGYQMGKGMATIMKSMFGGMAEGGKVPGKAEVSGDSYSNDKVHALLSPGELIVPRSISRDPDAVRDFVIHLNKNKKAMGGYQNVVEAKDKAKKLGGNRG